MYNVCVDTNQTMADQKGIGLNIKAVSERTGVPLHTLRAWERRYGVPQPQRNTENRYRLYDEQDIAAVLWMKRQVEAGVSPARASAMLRQQAHETLPTVVPTSPPVIEMQRALYDAFVARDDTTAQQIFNQAWSMFAPEQVVLDILQPTLRQIGKAWQQNTLSVEQEHFASNLIRQRLHALLQAQPAPAPSAPILVAACAPEEQHDLGLLIFTLLAKRSGWNVKYLGQRTPLSELYRAGEGAQFIVVSVSTVTGLASLVPLWSRNLPSATMLFGGEILNLTPALQAHLPGAFLANDGVRAIQQLATTTPKPSNWKPARPLLNAALDLDAIRLLVVGDTVQQFMEGLPEMGHAARTEYQHGLNHAALFFTDTLVSALAFDAPGLMELHGAWVNEFMPSHAVSITELHRFVNIYADRCSQVLPADDAQWVRELTQRFVRSSGREEHEL